MEHSKIALTLAAASGLVVTGAASAASVVTLIDDDFSSGTMTNNRYLRADTQADAGWITNADGADPVWEITGGVARRTFEQQFNPVGFGQIVTNPVASGTEIEFSFDYDVPVSGFQGDQNQLFVGTVWGINGSGSIPNIFDGSTIDLFGDEGFGPAPTGTGTPGGTYQFTELTDLRFTLGDGVFGSGSVSQTTTLGADYDFLAVTFAQDNLNNGDVPTTIDDVFLGTVVPEPTSVSFGLVAAAGLMLRRRKTAL